MLPKLLLILATSLAIATASAPRGVSPQGDFIQLLPSPYPRLTGADAKLYTPAADTFACLAHPSVQIPFSRVNDDFCDCPDGSDEPGTAACANVPPKNLAIPGFYCRNPGHTPAFLPLSRVNDGVCDYDICCDGSDEYAAVGGVKCPSKCKEIGHAARKMAAERLARRSKGAAARDALVQKAASLRREIQDNIASAKTNIQASELSVKKAEQALKETEERERGEAVRNPAAGGKVNVVVEVARQRVEELRGLMAKLREQRDQAEERLEKTEAILGVLKTDYNPNFNDEGVKRVIRAWEEYQADPLTSTNRNKAEDRDIQEQIDSSQIDWDELAGPPAEPSTAGGKVDMIVEVARQRVEELRGRMAKLQEQSAQAEQRLEKTEAILGVLKTDYNPNFNDEGVKRVIRAWEEYQADPLTSTNRNKADDRDIQENIDSDKIDWDGLAGPLEEDVPDRMSPVLLPTSITADNSAVFPLTQHLPPGARRWIGDKIYGFRQFLVAQGVLAPKPAGSESPAVAAARNNLATAETDLKNGQEQLRDLETDLSAAFGPSDVFRPLKGTCISREFGEYKYEYCFMEKAHQISRKDGSRTSLGSFKEIELADESANDQANGAVFPGSWEESHEEPLGGVSLRHDNGQQCWNGPQRSVQVHLYCFAENEIRSVVEAEKCVYRFEVGTPAVCGNGEEKEKAKDEL